MLTDVFYHSSSSLVHVCRNTDAFVERASRLLDSLIRPQATDKATSNSVAPAGNSGMDVPPGAVGFNALGTPGVKSI